MPQFDFFSFFVQIFWLVIAACLFHLIYLKMPLNNSSSVLKFREKYKTLVSNVVVKIKSNGLYEKIVSIWFKKKK